MSQAFHGGRLREARETFARAQFLDFSVNTNAFWLPPTLPGAVPLADAVAQYPEADAFSVAARFSEIHGVPQAHLLPTAGAIEGLYLAARLFQGKRAAVFHPSFADYTRACEAAGVETVALELLPEPPSLERAFASLEKADVVFLGNPNNPTGRLFPDLEALIESPRLAHLAWVIDEAFIEFTPTPLRSSLLQKLGGLPNVILLRALTKSWSVPGLRLGFLATSHPAWMTRLRAMQPPWPLSGVTEAWAKANLTSENQRLMQESLAALAGLRQGLSNGIQALGELRAFPSESNFILVESVRQDATRLYDRLGAEGILIRVCHGFQGLEGRRFFRVAVRSEPDNARLLDALAECTVAPTRAPRAKSPKPMRAISVLGTSSNSGKSWVATALCAWLRRKGLRVAPFKAQTLSNHSAVTADGGEIGRAQAVQAEACGLLPSVRMNPILLKPSGASGSQLVRLGRAEGHIKAAEYYTRIEELWPTVTDSLAYWSTRCDALVLEGAGSPVELNLMQRDMANLRPVRNLDSRWLLVADVERGGVFGQAAGTWTLLPHADRARCLGLIVNKFRGDLSLFSDAAQYFAPHFGAPLLGTLPYAEKLQPENEDSLSAEPAAALTGEPLHWIRFPHLSNSQDTNPWGLDEGVRIEWTQKPETLAEAKVIVLPGTKDTLADLRWLKRSGLADAILQARQRGALILGICGGFQMLGELLSDPEGVAGEKGEESGLGMLPTRTQFSPEKEVRNVEAIFQGERWQSYEIHMGRTVFTGMLEPLLQVSDLSGPRPEGCRLGNVWGTYLHGFFEATEVRREVTRVSGISGHRASPVSFRRQREELYNGMADLLEEHLNLEELWRYVAD